MPLFKPGFPAPPYFFNTLTFLHPSAHPPHERQSARTYLEKFVDEFAGCDADNLIKHALLALRESVGDGELTARNTTIAIVGEDQAFTILEGADLQPHLAEIEDGDEAAEGGDGDDGAVDNA